MRRTSLRVPRGTTSSACDGGGRALGVAWESRRQRRIVHLLRWMDETRAGTRQEFVRIDDNGNENHEEPPPFPHLPARTSATQAATAPGSPRPEEYNAARNCGPCPVVSGRGSTTVCHSLALELVMTRNRDSTLHTFSRRPWFGWTHRVVRVSVVHAPRASPLALVVARRRPSVFPRQSRSAAPRLATHRRAAGPGCRRPRCTDDRCLSAPSLSTKSFCGLWLLAERHR